MLKSSVLTCWFIEQNESFLRFIRYAFFYGNFRFFKFCGMPQVIDGATMVKFSNLMLSYLRDPETMLLDLWPSHDNRWLPVCLCRGKIHWYIFKEALYNFWNLYFHFYGCFQRTPHLWFECSDLVPNFEWTKSRSKFPACNQDRKFLSIYPVSEFLWTFVRRIVELPRLPRLFGHFLYFRSFLPRAFCESRIVNSFGLRDILDMRCVAWIFLLYAGSHFYQSYLILANIFDVRATFFKDFKIWSETQTKYQNSIEELWFFEVMKVTWLAWEDGA